jgi:hypothetical protein
MIRVVNPAGMTCGSGFVIRRDGYIVTCHHVIYDLQRIDVEFRGERYSATWEEQLSCPDADLAVLHIPVEDAAAAPIINPEGLSGSVLVYGFPPSRQYQFPQGYAIEAKSIRPSTPVATLRTYPQKQISHQNPWNRLPSPDSVFRAYRIDAPVDPGTSGGPVLGLDLGGVVGIVQSTNIGNKAEAYAIRWDNLRSSLLHLGLEPLHNSVCSYLRAVEERISRVRLFHMAEPIDLTKQYIAVRLAAHRTLRDQSESNRARPDDDSLRAYVTQRWELASISDQVRWEHAKERWPLLTVLADPGMGKSTLLREEARSLASRERQAVERHEKAASDAVLPVYVRLADLSVVGGDLPAAVVQVLGQDHDPAVIEVITPVLERKLRNGGCVLLLDGLDEVALADRKELSKQVNQFARGSACPIYCTSRTAGYRGALIDDAKEVEILPLNWSETTEFVNSWWSNVVGASRADHASPDALLRELRQRPQFLGLVQNPLMLSLVCSLYQDGTLPLPTRRHELYDRATDLMMRSWRADRLYQPEGIVIAKQRLLETLAYGFSSQSKNVFTYDELYDRITAYLQTRPPDLRQASASDLIADLSEGAGMFTTVQARGRKLIFLHRTFQKQVIN